MSDAVAVPLWLALLAGLLAAWAFYEHVLMPALRWLVTRPARRLVEESEACFALGCPSSRSSPTMPTPSLTFSDWTAG